nr:MAG TPA: hypothetical protein [Caudoviricetes sp.]DAS13830.1 MAG TPA: hypothetical protein [Caudoviricetes sp.]
MREASGAFYYLRNVKKVAPRKNNCVKSCFLR